MKMLRSNDCAASSQFSRTDRIYNDLETGLWYFRTREGNDIGPFRYRTEAEEMLARFLSGVQEASREAGAVNKLRFRMASVPRDVDPGYSSVSPGI